MARPRLTIGEHGKITTTRLPDGRHRARARFRGLDGTMRDVEALGASRPKAERALKARVRERVGDRTGDGELTLDTRLRDLAALWWDTIEQRTRGGELSEDTRLDYLRYRDYVVDACGDLTIRECTVKRLERAVLTRAGDKKYVRSAMKRTLVAMFNEAIRHDLLNYNLAEKIKLGSPIREETQALTLEQLADMRSRIHQYETTGGAKAPRAEGKGAGGRPRSKYLMDVFDLQVGIGCRIGELLALQWDDVNGLDGNSPTVTINATLKHRSKAEAARLNLPSGLYRQDRPKTRAGRRVVVLPQFAVAILRRLHKARTPGVPWIIATSVGTPRSPANVRTALRKARGEEYQWVIPHTLRKTNGTHITRETGSILSAADILGHANTGITESAYTDWSQIKTDVSEVVQGLAPKVTYLNENVG